MRSIPVSCPAYRSSSRPDHRNLGNSSCPETLVNGAFNLSEFILSNPFTRHKYHIYQLYWIEKDVTGLKDRLEIMKQGAIASALFSIYLICFSTLIFAVFQKISNPSKDLHVIKSGVEFYKRSIVPALEKNPYIAAKIGVPSLVALKTINRFQINTAHINILESNREVRNAALSRDSNLTEENFRLSKEIRSLKEKNEKLLAQLSKGSAGATPVIEWANLTHQETKNRIAKFLEELIETRDPKCWSILKDIIQKHVISLQAKTLLLKGVLALKENRPFIVKKSDLSLLHENAYSTSPIIVQVLANILFKKSIRQDSTGKVESPYDPYKDKEAYICQHYQEGQIRALLLQGIQALRNKTPKQLLSKYEVLLKEHKLKCHVSISPLIQEILDNQES